MKPAKRPTSNAQLRAFPESETWRCGDAGTRSRKFTLENRLWEFIPAVIDLSESLPTTRADHRIAGQILRSGTSPYPIHGEAEAEESREDLMRQMKICLNELCETRRWPRLIKRKARVKNLTTLLFVPGEGDGLVRIVHAGGQTAKRNAAAPTRKQTEGCQTPPHKSDQPVLCADRLECWT